MRFSTINGKTASDLVSGRAAISLNLGSFVTSLATISLPVFATVPINPSPILILAKEGSALGEQFKELALNRNVLMPSSIV